MYINIDTNSQRSGKEKKYSNFAVEALSEAILATTWMYPVVLVLTFAEESCTLDINTLSETEHIKLNP